MHTLLSWRRQFEHSLGIPTHWVYNNVLLVFKIKKQIIIDFFIKKEIYVYLGKNKKYM